MQKIKFWSNWDANSRYPYLFLLLLAVLSLLLGVYHYLTGDNLTFAWDKITDLQVVPLPVHESNHLLQNFTLSADGYLLLEQYDVAQPFVNTLAAALLLGIVAVSIAFYTAAISTMKQLGYFGGILLLMLFLATCNFDLLEVFGNGGQGMLLFSIILLASVSYGFQAFWQQVRFGWRVLAMAGVVLLLVLLIYGEAQFPARLITLHLVNYSSIGLLVATVLFIIWVSYENINVLLWINTQGKTPARRFSLWQFMLISGLYLLNLVLLYLRQLGYIQADLFYLNGYIILLLSAIAGFWGMRQREAYYKSLFLFRPTGAVLYLVFAILSFLSIGYAFATANDPLVIMYRDIIEYTHLAFGLGFLLYVLINFSKLLEERLQVYKVVYQPQRFSLFTFFLMSFIVCAILVVRAQYRVYFFAKAGYYNYLGDLYRTSGNDILAERFYEESDVYDANNVKANYSLAGLYRQQQERNNEILRIQEALEKRPNPKLYVRLANLYDQKQYFFEKLYVLREGVEKFPKSSELYNNLALLYMQTNVLDSTEYYFDMAQKYSADPDYIRSNRLAFYTRQAMLEPAKVVLEESRKGHYKPLRSNMAALRQLLGMDLQEKEVFQPDSLKEVEDMTLFYNQTISTLDKGDTTRLKGINSYLQAPGNQMFYEDLLYLKGLVQHYNGRPREARSILENLALQYGERSAYYSNALGLWMLEEQNYRAAAAYFKEAKDKGFTPAYLSQGYALALAHQPEAAVAALEEVAYTDDPEAVNTAHALAAVLRMDVPTVLAQGSDKDKVQYLLTYLPQLRLTQVDTLVQAIGEKEMKRRALVARVEYLMDQQLWRQAYMAIKETGAQLQPEGELRSALNVQQLKLWLNTGEYDVLLNRMNNLYLTDRDKRLNLYFKARVAEVKGRNREAAERYQQALKMLLYREDVVLAAAKFFKKYQPKQEQSYDILLSGITYNPYAAELYKAYALESLNQGLSSYAEQALTTLQNLLPATEYSTFIKKYEKQREDLAARADNWQL
ncbi:tetratricopeptide repeat protein [Pontibacter chitinilyticus]|uniref:tetratricopeptide repeat protein n=1 Tax=Pontibacter chitinilyticus TaxID=2674989 RepID=UPI00321BE13A